MSGIAVPLRLRGDGITEATESPVSDALSARWRRAVPVLALLTLALIGTVVWSAGSGQFPVAAGDVVQSVLHRLGLAGPPAHDGVAESVLWNVRFPRLALTVVVGAALGVTGTLVQGVFANPLAEPGILGVSAGCAAGACLVIVAGVGAENGYGLAAGAFVAGLGTTLLVYALSRSGGRTQVLTLVLTGIAVNAVMNAIIAFCVFLADTADREQIIFWQLGSFNGAQWNAVKIAGPVVAIGIVAAMTRSRHLDLLALGESSARHLGVGVERLRGSAIVLVALLTSVAVAFCGIIAFVGLVVPHLMRLLLGPSHRILIPATVLGGALLVTLADLVARTAIDFADLPIGMLTALVGGPFFFGLLRWTMTIRGAR